MENNETLLKQRDMLMMEVQFVGFISELTNATLQYLGRLKNPRTNQLNKSIQQAEKMIYILEMLEKKTKNNVTDLEKEHLQNSIDRIKRIFFEEKQIKEDPTEEISIRHILVGTQEEANEVLKKLTNGEDFAETAKEYSICNSRANGGYMEGIKKGALPQTVEEAAFKLQKDQISQIAVSVLGYHIVKLVDKKNV